MVVSSETRNTATLATQKTGQGEAAGAAATGGTAPAAAAARFESVLQQFPEDSLATQRLADVRKSMKRADRSRNVGNVIHYCRWRQIQRLIMLLAEDAGAATVH